MATQLVPYKVTSYKVLRRDSVTSHSEMLFKTNFWLICIWQRLVLVYCQILPQQDLNDYFTKKPPFQTCNSYEPSCDLSVKQLRTFKKGGGAQNPQTQTTTSYEKVSPTLLPASTSGACSVSCSLGSWWLFRAQTSATPPKFFLTLCNQRYGCHALLWHLSLNWISAVGWPLT